jgi:hypothetical protein
VCKHLRFIISQLKEEAYEPFAIEVEKFKDAFAFVQLADGDLEGRILQVNPESITLMRDDKVKVEVQIEEVQFIQFM